MAANIIRLHPLNPNQILIDDDDPNVILLTDESGVLPPDYRPNPNSTVVGGNDAQKARQGSSDPFTKKVDRPSGNK
jgi:hypothetical protein